MVIVILKSIDAFAHMDLQEAIAVKSGPWDSGKWLKRPKISYSDLHHMHQLVSHRFLWFSHNLLLIPNSFLDDLSQLKYAVYGDTMYIIGGESYQRASLIYAYDFNGNVWETVHVESTNVPTPRYASSSVVYGDKIFMFGGVTESSGISNELWAFDISARNWENVTVKTEGCNNTAINCRLPLACAGHTATVSN